MRRCIVLLATMLFVAAAFAADISGKWVAQMTSPSGSQSERIFMFKVSGDKLTGTIANQQVYFATFEEKGKPKMTGTLKTQSANPQEISEGKVSGDDISFVIVSNMMGNEVRTIYTGKISGNEIVFAAETKYPPGVTPPGPPGAAGGQPPPPQKIVAKRATE
ncbi:MAG: hypothetical protein JW963_26300 [Anaerolineales bacterium]|nr:hypothetical protein [Anaerolineales bacterium]